MIELHDNELIIRFPEVHKNALCHINFQRTLRIPDDGREYPLPAGMGCFPLNHIEDYPEKAPSHWLDRGGVIMPMYQSEALWIDFDGDYPMAIKVAAGKINALSGESWSNELVADPQDYIVSDRQPWLDGFSIKKGLIRQFVAMPLGAGYSAEEQITGAAEFAGLQIIAYPMKAEMYEKMMANRHFYETPLASTDIDCCCEDSAEMSLAPGGLMRQVIHDDPYGIDAWDTENASRVFVHLVNSEVYEAITDQRPPQLPITKQEYQNQALPWFDYYAKGEAIEGSDVLHKLKSTSETAKLKNELLWDNASMNMGSVKLIDAQSKSKIVTDKNF